MARLKEIDDEPITQFGSQVDRALARHILALEREHNEREDPAEPVDSARCKCGHLSADHHTPKFAGMNNVVKFECIQCRCSDFRSVEQKHQEPESIAWVTAEEERKAAIALLQECLPYLDGEMIRRTGHEFDCDADAKLRDLIGRIRAQIGEENP